MTPPRCNHACAPRSASSVYRLAAPFFEAPCAVNRFNRHCLGSGAQQRGTRLSAVRLLPRTAPPLCTLFLLCLLALSLGVADRRRPIGPPTCQEKIRTETKSGPTEHHQQREFCNKDGKRHVRRWRHDREKPFGCDKNMLETENGADSSPNHGGVITPP